MRCGLVDGHSSVHAARGGGVVYWGDNLDAEVTSIEQEITCRALLPWSDTE